MGEVDSIKHCEKRLPLKWRSFQERSNFQRICFRSLKFRIWGLEIKHMKAHNFVWQGCFFLSVFGNFDNQLSWNFHRFVIFFICWDTPSEKSGLWQLPIVSNVFKKHYVNYVNYILNCFIVKQNTCKFNCKYEALV